MFFGSHYSEDRMEMAQVESVQAVNYVIAEEL